MNKLLFSSLSERQRLAELLRWCSKNLLLGQGIQVHEAIVKRGLAIDLMLSNDLIDMYSKCGRISAAREVFDKMLEKNVVSWTALMCGYVRSGNAKESLSLFSHMGFSKVKPNEFTLSINLKACSMMNFVGIGMQIHCICVRTGYDLVIVVGNSIADMYLKCRRVDKAVCMFETMPARNLISWNLMISGLGLAGFGQRAIVMFWKMRGDGQVPDEFTLTSTFKACRDLGAIREGSQVHAFLLTSGSPYAGSPTIAGALIDLYVKCRRLTEARKVFCLIEQKSTISWSSLILGYAQEGNLGEAMNLYRQLRESNLEVDWFTLSSILAIFADFALLEQGREIHAYTLKVPSGTDISVRNSLMDMYMKCGMIDEAEKAFNKMPVRNVISWTVLITGYGKHGLAKEALSFFNRMQLEAIEPDDVTYLAVLLACSHSGLIEEGQEYFSRLLNDKNKARVEHYACMVDLLGRAGRLMEAKKLIDTMPLRPNVGMWQTLLSACRVYKDLELGRRVGDELLLIDGYNPVNYVMLSNMYADAGYWKECERLRELVKTKRLKKDAGCSWVEIDKEIHYLYGGDKLHPLAKEVQELLKEMERRMKEELGYVYGVQYALYDVDEESKEENLRGHSEKLAIGLALVSGGLEGKEGKVIRVFKNLRVCGDCHEFIKGLSKILKMVFVVRDANRFHRFEDGCCTCRDYW